MKATKASNQWLKRQGKAGPGHPQNFPLSICHFPRAESQVLGTPVNQFECCPEQRQQVEMYWRVKSGCQCVSKMPWRVLWSFNPSVLQSASQSVNQEMAKYSLLPGKGRQVAGRRSQDEE